jgi:ESCRT-II complex subunit VPS36
MPSVPSRTRPLRAGRPFSNLKSPRHQSGTIHATSHRLFFISAQYSAFPASGTAEVGLDCFALDLGLIQRTEHYAGLFASSPKITLHLSRPAGELRGIRVSADARASRDGLVATAALGWECEVCGNKNLPGANPHVARVCGLCGVPAANVPGGADAPSPSISTAPKTVPRPMPAHVASSASHLSSSLPVDSGMAALGRKDSSAPDDGGGCPVCTFLNHPSLRECEMCGTPLPRTQRAPALSAMTMVKSAPSSRPHSPVPSDDDDEAKEGMLRISFRRAGDKAFYAVLKGVLQARAWEVSTCQL